MYGLPKDILKEEQKKQGGGGGIQNYKRPGFYAEYKYPGFYVRSQLYYFIAALRSLKQTVF